MIKRALKRFPRNDCRHCQGLSLRAVDTRRPITTPIVKSTLGEVIGRRGIEQKNLLKDASQN